MADRRAEPAKNGEAIASSDVVLALVGVPGDVALATGGPMSDDPFSERAIRERLDARAMRKAGWIKQAEVLAAIDRVADFGAGRDWPEEDRWPDLPYVAQEIIVNYLRAELGDL